MRNTCSFEIHILVLNIKKKNIVAGVGLGGKPIIYFVLPCVVQCLKSVPLLCRLTLV